MNLPPLPPLNPAPAMSLDQFDPGEMAVSIRACENFAKLYAKEYGESCARMAREEAAKLCDNVAANYTKHYELGAKECAAAIRKG